MSRRRILFVIKNLQQGGTERQVLRMMRAVARERFDVALCTLSPEVHYEDVAYGEPRYALAAPARHAVVALRSVIEDFRPDLIHSFRDVVNRWVWRALDGLSFAPAWLMSVRGRPVLPLDLAWASIMYRRAFRVAVNSVGVAAVLDRFTTIPRDRIAVVPNLIDEVAFAPPKPGRRQAARAALGLPASAFVWVLPGRLSWVKNQLGLLAALWLLRRRRALPAETIVLLAGRRRDLVPSALVPRLVRLLGLSTHVRIEDAVKRVDMLYAAADALVLPSIAEGMSNVLLEAQLSGLPVVVTPEANSDRLVVDGETGLCVPSLSPSDLADQIGRMMSLPPEGRRSLAENARASLLRRLASPAIAAELAALYEAALASRSVADDNEAAGAPGARMVAG